jgi:hypothetical protein
MRLRTLAFLLPAILLTGCTDFMDFDLDLDITIPVSLHPLATQDDIIFDETLLGRWQGPEDLVVVFEEGSDSDTYAVKYFEDSIQVGSFQATLTDLDGTVILDISTPGPDPNILEMNKLLYLPTHAYMKIEHREPTLSMQLAFFDLMLADDPNALKHETVISADDTYLVITASTKQLRRFIRTYAEDEKLFTEALELHRYAAVPSEDPNTVSCPNDLPEKPVRDE